MYEKKKALAGEVFFTIKRSGTSETHARADSSNPGKDNIKKMAVSNNKPAFRSIYIPLLAGFPSDTI
ncbi:MAG: hypothetical protein V1883_02660 [Candidatus Omnitrophota bacterium]